MSFETKKETVKEQLEKAAYHDLRKEFDKLGIVKEWSPGVSRVDLIERAMKALAIIEKAKEVAGEDGDIEKEIANIKEQEKVEQEKIEQEKQVELQKEQSTLRFKNSTDGKLDLEKLYKSRKSCLNFLKHQALDLNKKRLRSAMVLELEELIKEAGGKID